jgi:hypothetical protein
MYLCSAALSLFQDGARFPALETLALSSDFAMLNMEGVMDSCPALKHLSIHKRRRCPEVIASLTPKLVQWLRRFDPAMLPKWLRDGMERDDRLKLLKS